MGGLLQMGQSRSGDSNLRPLGGGLAGRRLTASCPTTMTQERTSHLLSVIRAAMRQQGVGDATSSGLVWSTGFGIVATIHNERGGSRVEVSANRSFALIPSGISGLVSGLLASVNSNGTPDDAIISLVIGLTVAIGLWATLTIRTRRREVVLMDTVTRTMAQRGRFTSQLSPPAPSRTRCTPPTRPSGTCTTGRTPARSGCVVAARTGR